VLSRSRASLIGRLSRRRTREDEGLFLAEGVRVVEDLLAAGIVTRFALISSSLEDTERGERLARRLEAAAEVERVSDAELAALADTATPQGVLVVAEIPERRLEALDVAPDAVFLVLDAVQDPGNMGTLVRTAEGLGVSGVLSLPGTVDAWNPKVVRAAAGSVFRLPVVSVAAEALGAWLERHRVTALAADMGGAAVDAADPGGAVALVVGNEGAGLGEAAATLARARVAVPLRGAAESLNVAVAAAILLHELVRARTGGGTGGVGGEG